MPDQEQRIVVEVADGRVTQVWGIPAGVVVEIRDYDAPDYAPGPYPTDESGEEYLSEEWRDGE
jgi:hypothetical protein